MIYIGSPTGIKPIFPGRRASDFARIAEFAGIEN